MELAVIYQYPLSWSCMKIWYACQVVVALHATMALELVLMFRGASIQVLLDPSQA